MIVKVVNNTIGYNDLVFILLVFGIFFRIINDNIFILFITEKAKIINIIIIEILKLHVTRQINNVLYQRNDFYIMRIYNILIDSSIFV